jgi:septum formation protein
VLILASASPRRRELLEQICSTFRVVPSDIDERLDGPPVPTVVAELALRKARAVAAAVREGIVLGADTVVVLDDTALGKPATAAEARTMLRRLRGRPHHVITGVAVTDAATGRTATAAEVSRVLMRDYSDSLIESYVASGEPLDKAGAYAIQGKGGELVAGWVGSYTNIVGLPVAATRRLLAQFDVPLNPETTESRA